jgi:hypothetical protein
VKFYLGTHHPNWLWSGQIKSPLFVSRRRLFKYKTLKPAVNDWALDSGGFSELSMNGEWSVTPEQYAQEVRRFAYEIGRMDWAAIQDWMCEPQVREKTGRTVEEHQLLTVHNYLTLMDLAPDLPWAPVLQGWEEDDYFRHIDMYLKHGVRLFSERIVGIGSVCRRQHTAEISRIIGRLAKQGLSLHGFGVKTKGFDQYAEKLKSADSLAWSYAARRRPPLPQCEGQHKNCANCHHFAAQWRERVTAGISHLQDRKPVQRELFL